MPEKKTAGIEGYFLSIKSFTKEGFVPFSCLPEAHQMVSDAGT